MVHAVSAAIGAAITPPPGPKTSIPALQKAVFKLNEFSFVYGVSRSTAYRAMAAGKLRSIKAGGRRLIRREDAEAFLAGGAK